MTLKRIFDIVVILSILSLSACQIPVQLVTQVTQQPPPAADKNDNYALLNERLSMIETKMASQADLVKDLPSTPVPQDTLAPVNTATAVLTATPMVTPSATSIIPCNRATFMGDITIPDGTIIQLGDTFTKTWRFTNTGSCTWGDGYTLVFDHGNSLGGPQSMPLPQTVAPGNDLVVSVSMTAPSYNGNYESYWMLQDPNGNKFGIGTDGKTAFWTKITAGIYRPQDPESFGACSLIDVTPDAYTIFPTSKPVEIKWVIRNNTGSSWLQNYTVNFIKGERMQTSNDVFLLGQDVAPYQNAGVVVEVVTPDRPGAFTTVWSINDGGKKVCTFSATLKVK
jgi:hypothetical protein